MVVEIFFNLFKYSHKSFVLIDLLVFIIQGVLKPRNTILLYQFLLKIKCETRNNFFSTSCK